MPSERGHKIICEDGKLRKPTPGQIGQEVLKRLWELVDYNGNDSEFVHLLKAEINALADGHFSVSGQGQEERDFNFKDALDSVLFELLDKCRENCNHGCHTVDDDTAWDECPDHKFMTDEIDKLRKLTWPKNRRTTRRWPMKLPLQTRPRMERAA